MSEQLLLVENLVAGWNGRAVVELASLKVCAGEIVVLAGPNGCGKSTLLKTLARQTPALSGSFKVGGASCAEMSAAQFARLTAYVPQLIDPPHKLTVFDMIALGRNPHQKWWSWHQTAEDRAAIESAMNACDVSAFQNRQVATLSGGEQQRVALAMALSQQTSVIILDEPTAHLDYRHQLDLVSLLHDLRARGIGILVALHDLNLISRIATSVVLLQKGEPSCTISSGPAQDVLTADNLRVVYGIDVSIARDESTGLVSFIPVKPAS